MVCSCCLSRYQALRGGWSLAVDMAGWPSTWKAWKVREFKDDQRNISELRNKHPIGSDDELDWKCLFTPTFFGGQASHTSWKVLEFFCKIFRTWKVLENDFGFGKSWKLKLKVREFAGMQLQWCRCENFRARTPVVFVICSYSDKTFFFATCDSDDIAVWMLLSCFYIWSK